MCCSRGVSIPVASRRCAVSSGVDEARSTWQAYASKFMSHRFGIDAVTFVQMGGVRLLGRLGTPA